MKCNVFWRDSGGQMLAALGMIGLILMQHGKGADMGAAFGSGSSGSLFGASGSANFLSRTTAPGHGVLCLHAGPGLSGQHTPCQHGSVLEGAAASIPAPAAVSGCARARGDDVPAGAAACCHCGACSREII
jgi:preprotein translocase subunit SecG